MTTSLNRFSHYPKPQHKMNFWTNIEKNDCSVQDTNNTFSDSEEYVTEDEQHILHTPAVAIKKRKAVDVLEPTINHIKRIAIGDDEMTKRVQQFYDTLLAEKRKAIGDELHWQRGDETANKAARLDGTINVIMQARKALMSKDNEGVTITIESSGWNDKAHIRPKYSIAITRVQPPSQ